MLTTTFRISRSGPWAALTAGCTALILIFASIAPAPANAADDDYTFCTLDSEYIKYYSAIFLGDYSAAYSLKSAFYKYLLKKYVLDTAGLTDVFCTFENTYAAAQREYEEKFRADEKKHVHQVDAGELILVKYYQQVVRTNWAPDNFSPQPLRDFNITLSSGQRKVEVCVRDHECEDGDEVRISVNGGRVFSGEIFNDWDCDDVPVQQGRNRVELYAINGTGHKGNCSYVDRNTGEIRVSGKNSQTQSWQHRGGAGSSANIIVEVE